MEQSKILTENNSIEADFIYLNAGEVFELAARDPDVINAVLKKLMLAGFMVALTVSELTYERITRTLATSSLYRKNSITVLPITTAKSSANDFGNTILQAQIPLPIYTTIQERKNYG